jgi:hypothetical protein
MAMTVCRNSRKRLHGAIGQRRGEVYAGLHDRGAAMRYSAIVIACSAVLAGCSKSPQVHEKNASVAEVASAVRQSGVASDIFLRAGEWRVSGTMEEMNIPGLPPEAQAEMKKAMGEHGNMTYQYCLTPEEAKEPRGKFFSGKAQNNCRYDHFTMGGGKIDALMRCNEVSGAMTMAIAGTYSPEDYSSHLTMNMLDGSQRGMSMRMRSEAHRVGECTAAEKAKAEKDSGTKG